jgi:hypothetical protein
MKFTVFIVITCYAALATTTFQCYSGGVLVTKGCGWRLKPDDHTCVSSVCGTTQANGVSIYCPGDGGNPYCDFICPAGQYRFSTCTTCVNTVYAACPIGYYCPGDNNMYACNTCPQRGFIPGSGPCTTVGNSANPTCIPDGYFWDGAALQQCTQCTGGRTILKACMSSDTVCSACPFGTYLLNGQCQVCEPKFYCFNNTKLACPENSTSPPNSSSYADCYCKPGFTGAVNSPNRTSCTPCPIGSFCPSTIIATSCQC